MNQHPLSTQLEQLQTELDRFPPPVAADPLLEVISILFFFQSEDGIRAGHVTGVQKCALPILSVRSTWPACARPQRRAATTGARPMYRCARLLGLSPISIPKPAGMLAPGFRVLCLAKASAIQTAVRTAVPGEGKTMWKPSAT